MADLCCKLKPRISAILQSLVTQTVAVLKLHPYLMYILGKDEIYSTLLLIFYADVGCKM